MSSPIRLPFGRRDDASGRRRALALDPTSWSGALILMGLLAAVLWIVQIVNASESQDLDRFGIKPRAVDGLWGVLAGPFLHANYDHMLSNTVPLIGIGWVLLLAGVRIWLIVTAIVVLVGGLLTWAVGPSNTVIVGASGMVFGWLGYLLGRAVFSRQVKWIVVAVVVLIFFGTLLFGLIPVPRSHISWQAHVCGFAAGVGAAGLLHPRGGETRSFRRSAVS